MWNADDLPYWVAWSRPGGTRGTDLLALLRAFGSLKAAWEAPASELPSGLPPRFLAARATCDPQQAWAEVQRPGQRILAYPDADFPKPLREIDDPPALLYVRGELPGWSRAIAVIGARAATPYGVRMARRLGSELAALGGLVVSGAAAGIDTAAHWGALEAGSTVAVLGCGLDHVYPLSNAQLYQRVAASGALITEHPPYERPAKHHFPRRNRLITGLSCGVVVVEAGMNSGTSATVKVASEVQHRQIFAVPGQADSPASFGTHALLRDGVRLTTSAYDVFKEFGWQHQSQPPDEPPATPSEAFILELLRSGPCSLEAIQARTILTPAQLAGTLLHLELAARVRRLPGPCYVLA